MLGISLLQSACNNVTLLRTCTDRSKLGAYMPDNNSISKLGYWVNDVWKCELIPTYRYYPTKIEIVERNLKSMRSEDR